MEQTKKPYWLLVVPLLIALVAVVSGGLQKNHTIPMPNAPQAATLESQYAYLNDNFDEIIDEITGLVADLKLAHRDGTDLLDLEVDVTDMADLVDFDLESIRAGYREIEFFRLALERELEMQLEDPITAAILEQNIAQFNELVRKIEEYMDTYNGGDYIPPEAAEEIAQLERIRTLTQELTIAAVEILVALEDEINALRAAGLMEDYEWADKMREITQLRAEILAEWNLYYGSSIQYPLQSGLLNDAARRYINGETSTGAFREEIARNLPPIQHVR